MYHIPIRATLSISRACVEAASTGGAGAKSFHTKNGTVTPPCCVVAGAGRRSLRPPHRWLTTGSATARAASSTGSHRLLSHGSACVGDCALLYHARHRRCARSGSTGDNRWAETLARSGDDRTASAPPFWLCESCSCPRRHRPCHSVAPYTSHPAWSTDRETGRRVSHTRHSAVG